MRRCSQALALLYAGDTDYLVTELVTIRPLSLVVRTVEMPVLMLCSVTLAPGMTASERVPYGALNPAAIFLSRQDPRNKCQ